MGPFPQGWLSVAPVDLLKADSGWDLRADHTRC